VLLEGSVGSLRHGNHTPKAACSGLKATYGKATPPRIRTLTTLTTAQASHIARVQHVSNQKFASAQTRKLPKTLEVLQRFSDFVVGDHIPFTAFQINYGHQL
jgi:hypothetical protein